jgi:hypothetical protein
MWNFNDLCTTTIALLTPMFNESNAALQFILQKQYNIFEWIFPAVKNFIIRPQTLTEVDISTLSGAAATHIMKLHKENVIDQLDSYRRGQDIFLTYSICPSIEINSEFT